MQPWRRYTLPCGTICRICKHRRTPLETIARRHGVQVWKTGGSHFYFVHPHSEVAVSVPFKRPIKPVYILQFLTLIDDIGNDE